VEEVVEKAVELVEGYRLKKYHCAESSIRACSEALGIKLSDDILRIASGFRGGGGGYGDRCGILESGIILVSLLYGRDNSSIDVSGYSYLVRLLHDRFNEELGGYYCRNLRPFAYRVSGTAQNCGYVYHKGAEIVTRIMVDAERLIREMPETERYGRSPLRPFERIPTEPTEATSATRPSSC
jgi:C_GCAxxG_C_C family probable redox protein